MKKEFIKRQVEKHGAKTTVDQSQQQQKQIIAAAGKLRVQVQGSSNGKKNN